jgi:hypothetical protein
MVGPLQVVDDGVRRVCDLRRQLFVLIVPVNMKVGLGSVQADEGGHQGTFTFGGAAGCVAARLDPRFPAAEGDVRVPVRVRVRPEGAAAAP